MESLESIMMNEALKDAFLFLEDGGPSIWAIAALSVILLTAILWKIWRFTFTGVWKIARKSRKGFQNDVTRSIKALSPTDAREDVARVAKNRLAEASSGFRLLELISTIAPLLGLLGTVLGMIVAFQALQDSGSRADPSILAGGIWEALLTTAAGMAVAIPASIALTWFESVVERLRLDYEDIATQSFIEPSVSVATLRAAE